MKNKSSLSEISLELGINKSKLAYYQSVGLFKPEAYIGKTGIFDKKDTIKIIKKIEAEKKKGKKLIEIKKSLNK